MKTEKYIYGLIGMASIMLILFSLPKMPVIKAVFFLVGLQLLIFSFNKYWFNK